MQYIYKISGTKAEFINRDRTHGNDESVIHDSSGINKHKNPTETKDDCIWNLQTVFSEQETALVEQCNVDKSDVLAFLEANATKLS